MRFDVTLPVPGKPAEEHHRLDPAAVAELVRHAANHGQRLHIRPHTPTSPHPDHENTLPDSAGRP